MSSGFDRVPISGRRRVQSVEHGPGLRTEYAWLPTHDRPTRTGIHQVGVAFSGHHALVREWAGHTVRTSAPPGTVYVTGPEPIVWTEVDGITEALEIYLDPAMTTGWRDDVQPSSRPDPIVFGLACVLRRAHVGGGVVSDVEASTTAHRLARHLRATYGPDRGAPNRSRDGTLSRRQVAGVADRVDAGLAGPLSLDDLAAVAALSPFHFARAFRVTTGLTPHAFVTVRRIEAAKALLLVTRRSVPEVANAVGFTNVSHFRRVFRRETGVLPSDLRGT